MKEKFDFDKTVLDKIAASEVMRDEELFIGVLDEAIVSCYLKIMGIGGLEDGRN